MSHASGDVCAYIFWFLLRVGDLDAAMEWYYLVQVLPSLGSIQSDSATECVMPSLNVHAYASSRPSNGHMLFDCFLVFVELYSTSIPDEHCLDLR